MPQLQPYPKYKPSNIQWIDDIPQHWSVTRLKYLATINDETLSDTTEPSQELHYVDIGSVDPTNGITEIQELDFENAPSRARRIVRRGDVIVSTVRTYLRAIAPIKIDDPNLIVSTGFAVIRPERLDEGFAAYALQASHFVEQVVANSVGVSYPAINATEMAGFPIPHPEIPEQRAIADYLDHQTNLMDALVAKKQRMIELLAERRQSLITHAVTKGLDPQAPMRQSGIQWRPLKYFCTHTGEYGLNISSDRYMDSGVRLIRTSDIVDTTTLTPESNAVYLHHSECSDALLNEGDLLFSRAGTLGKCFLFRREHGEASFAGYLIRFIPKSDVDPRFLAYCAQTKFFEHAIESDAVQSTISNFNAEKYSNLLLPYHESSQQRAIADYLDHQTSIMDALTEKLSRQIELLAERRQSLITHAVTGKIDVTESKL